MDRRAGRFLAAGAAALVALSACTSDPAPVPTPTPSARQYAPVPGELATYYDQELAWESCGDGLACARLTVPADYDDPDGETLELAVGRRATDDPQGSLLLNPGGPGGSGMEYVRYARSALSGPVRARYDIVGFDPRGVADSSPVDCVDDEDLDEMLAADGTPDSAAEIAEIEDLSAQLGEGCVARSPDIAPYVDTESAARDMDILRAVLGDERLAYLGKSYGTFLGAQYAELFPDRVGRFVLDGVLPSSLDADEIGLGQARAFDVALRRFVAYCDTQSDCPLPGGVDAGVERIQQFLVSLEKEPLPGIGDRMLNESLATYAVLNSLYFPPGDWSNLIFGLQEAFAGDGSVLLDTLNDRIGRDRDGTYRTNGNEAFYAIACLDRPGLGGAAHAAQLARDWAEAAPVFGPYLAWGSLPCWQWPVGPGTAEAAGDLPVFTATGSDPILVVSTRFDTATPYEWGVQVAAELENATLLTYEGDGHTAYSTESTCIDDAVDAYLLDGVLPPDGASCEAVPVR